MISFNFERFNKTYKVTLIPTYYSYNQSLCIKIHCHSDCEWYLTTNLGDNPGKNKAYIDTNNLGHEIIDWIKNNGLGEPTGKVKTSGFFQYPEVKFCDDILMQFKNPDYEQYLAWQKEFGVEEGHVRLYPSCTVCGKVYPVTVTEEQAEMYKEYVLCGNYLIQEIFPDMPKEVRALFTRGQNICAACWKLMFGPFDDVEDENEKSTEE